MNSIILKLLDEHLMLIKHLTENVHRLTLLVESQSMLNDELLQRIKTLEKHGTN